MANLPSCGKAFRRLPLENREQLFGNNLTEAGMKKYMIEREIPNVGTLEGEQLRQAAARSNEALSQLGPDIQWLESYVVADKTFCVYLAKDEALIHRHAELSGFPATKVTEIGKTIDPTTAAPR
jgi:hypothetical protein